MTAIRNINKSSNEPYVDKDKPDTKEHIQLCFLVYEDQGQAELIYGEWCQISGYGERVEGGELY